MGKRRTARADWGRVLSDLAAWVRATFAHELRDPALWKRALTHGSLDDKQSYERLEFLGDRVLGLCMAEWLFQLFPNEPEGLLSRRINVLVSGATCAEIARGVGLPDRVLLGKGAPAQLKDSDNVLGDLVEALLAALYLEAGLDAARAWVRDRWSDRVRNSAESFKHPKATLQEWAEKHGRGVPCYDVVEESSAENGNLFTISASVKNASTSATAGTKREAETAAARALFEQLVANKPPKKVRTKMPRTILPAPRARTSGETSR